MPPSFLSRFLFDLCICIEFDAIEIRRVWNGNSKSLRLTEEPMNEWVSELTISLYLTNNTTEIRWIKSERQAFAWESQEWPPFITPQLSHRWTPRMTWTLLSIFLRLHWLSARRAVTCGSSYADFPFPSSTDSFPETQSAVEIDIEPLAGIHLSESFLHNIII